MTIPPLPPPSRSDVWIGSEQADSYLRTAMAVLQPIPADELGPTGRLLYAQACATVAAAMRLNEVERSLENLYNHRQ